MSSKDDTLKTVWGQVSTCIKRVLESDVAKSDAAFEKQVNHMISSAKKYGYDKCLKWSQNEAKTRKSLEDQLTQ